MENEKRLTPLQELLELNNKLKADNELTIIGIYNALINEIPKLIEKEKEIIIEAYKTGYTESGVLDWYPDKHSKEHYEINFKTH